MDKFISLFLTSNYLLMSKLSQVFLTVTDSTNLFDEEWTEGNLFKIEPVVNFLGSAASIIISFIGFFIVIFSIVRNAFALLYLCAPEIFDTVSDFKNMMVGNGNQSGGKGGKGRVFGSVAQIVFSLVPDIKSMTTFKDDGADGATSATSMTKKQRGTMLFKSIVGLVGSVFLGMAIFFGYPAKLANFLGSGVSYVLEAVFDNVDPRVIVNTMADGMFNQIQYRTEGSQDPVEKVINKAAKEMTKIVFSTYSDMNTEPKQTVAYEIEDFLIEHFNASEVSEVLSSDGYRTTVTASYNSSYPRFSKGFTQLMDKDGNRIDVWRARATDGSSTYKVVISAGSLSTGSTMVKENEHFVWTISVTPVALTSTSSTKLTLYAGFNQTMSTTDAVKIQISGLKIGEDSSQLSGTLGQKVTVELLYEGKVDSTGKEVLPDNEGKYPEGVKNALCNAKGVITLTAKLNGAASAPYLEFDKTDWNTVERASKDEKGNIKINKENIIYKITLPGSWKLNYNEADGIKSTYDVTTIILKNGATTLTADSPSRLEYDSNATSGKQLSELKALLTNTNTSTESEE